MPSWMLCFLTQVQIISDRTSFLYLGGMPSSSSEDENEIEQLLVAKERETSVVRKGRVPIRSLLDAYSIKAQ